MPVDSKLDPCQAAGNDAPTTDNMPIVLAAVAMVISVISGCVGFFALLMARKPRQERFGAPSPTDSGSQLYGSRA